MLSTGFSFVNAKGADLEGAGLGTADVSKTDFTNANPSNTQLSFAGMTIVEAPGANLSGAVLAYGNISGAKLKGANLSKVGLSSSDAIGVDLTGANITGINLSDADLTGSKLDGADLTDADYCNTIIPDGTVKNPTDGLCPGQPGASPSPTSD